MCLSNNSKLVEDEVKTDVTPEDVSGISVDFDFTGVVQCVGYVLREARLPGQSPEKVVWLQFLKVSDGEDNGDLVGTAPISNRGLSSPLTNLTAIGLLDEAAAQTPEGESIFPFTAEVQFEKQTSSRGRPYPILSAGHVLGEEDLDQLDKEAEEEDSDSESESAAA